MSEEIIEKEENSAVDETSIKDVETVSETEIAEEKPVEEEEQLTMADFEDEINASMKRFKEGDKVTGLIANIEDFVVYVDLGTFVHGIILPMELSDDPEFNMMDDLRIGQEISAIVINTDDGNGNLVLSLKQAVEAQAWEELREGLLNKTEYEVKIAKAVNGGMITYVNGIRAFIPISRLSIRHIEDSEKEAYVGKKLKAVIIEANEEKRSLVLSVRELEQREADELHQQKVTAIRVGAVMTGIVVTIKPYGCFVDIGDGISGLVHISQIAHERLKTPHEVVKEGQQVNVKVIDIKDGKISLSMKALVDVMEKNEEDNDLPSEYSSGEEASTGMAALLAGIKLD